MCRLPPGLLVHQGLDTLGAPRAGHVTLRSGHWESFHQGLHVLTSQRTNESTRPRRRLVGWSGLKAHCEVATRRVLI